MQSTSLAWRVPTSGDPRLLRLSLAQVALATVVAGLLIVVAAPREWVAAGLLGLIPLAIFMAYRRWSAYRHSLEGKDNVRIDDLGVHWLNSAGKEHSFQRDVIAGFHIGHDEETLRPVPALTLHLAGGFESQPIELHPPATSEVVRELLAGHWNITEQPPVPRGVGDYDVAAMIYSECHEEFREWHWEGSREELGRFFGLFAAAADELPCPPAGAKPAVRVVLINRRERARIRLGHALGSHFEPDLIAAPADILQAISTNAVSALAGAGDTADVGFDIKLGPSEMWTFHLHIRPA